MPPSMPARFPAIRKPWTIADSLILGSAVLPIIWLTFLVWRDGVSIPARDDWEMAPLIAKMRLGGLTFHDLFVQQQESRTFFPKLIFMLFASGRHWDVRAEMALSIVCASLTAAGIFFLLRRSALSARTLAVSFWLILLLIFSPAQHELWLLASGFPSFVPALCVVGGLMLAGTRISMRMKFAICAGLAVFSSFSLASGLFTWGLTFPVLLFVERPSSWRKYLIAWVMASALCASLYFWGYVPPGDLPKFAPHLSVLDYLFYLFAFLGSGLGRAGNSHPLAASIAIGFVLLGIYLSALSYALVRPRDRALPMRIAPWAALGLYSIGCGCLAALGRIEWGIAQSLESRYVAFSLYLAVADIVLVAMIATPFESPFASPRLRSIRLVTVGGAAAVFLTLYGLCALDSMPSFEMRSAVARSGKGAVLFSATLDTSAVIENALYPRAEFVVHNADTLDRLHLLTPPLIRTAVIKERGQMLADGNAASGWCDAIVASKPGYYTAIGWAELTGRNGSADCVVLAYQTDGGDWTVFALSDAMTIRPDVARAFSDKRRLWTGWLATFSETAVPSNARISAWAVDASSAAMYRLNQNPAVGVPNGGGRAGVLASE